VRVCFRVGGMIVTIGYETRLYFSTPSDNSIEPGTFDNAQGENI
jgi:hypothetical protein